VGPTMATAGTRDQCLLQLRVSMVTLRASDLSLAVIWVIPVALSSTLRSAAADSAVPTDLRDPVVRFELRRRLASVQLDLFAHLPAARQLHIGLIACSRTKPTDPSQAASCTSLRYSAPLVHTPSAATATAGGSCCRRGRASWSPPRCSHRTT
jgi:hypothetical protein